MTLASPPPTGCGQHKSFAFVARPVRAFARPVVTDVSCAQSKERNKIAREVEEEDGRDCVGNKALHVIPAPGVARWSIESVSFFKNQEARENGGAPPHDLLRDGSH